jgi:hypothetical protein
MKFSTRVCVDTVSIWSTVSLLTMFLLATISCSVVGADGTNQSCSGDPVTGPCRAFLRRWFYNSSAAECQPFVFGGCYGNDNNYRTQPDCKRICEGQLVRSKTNHARCHLAALKGNCKAALTRWYYDVTTMTCRRFVYGGCGGNNNRFTKRSQCIRVCGKPA